MNFNSIKNESEYQETLKEIEKLMRAEPDTLEGEKLDILVNLVETYESKNYQLNLPDPG